jgi:hypothetical protein
MEPESAKNSTDIQSTGSQTQEHQQQFYKPSWFDRFNNWTENLSLNVWMFHLMVGILLVVLQVFLLWLEAGSISNELLPVIIFNSLAIPYLLVVILLLDNQAGRGIRLMNSVLNFSDREFDQYEYRLINMPVLEPLIAGSVLTVLTILTPLVSVEPVRYMALEQLPVFSVVFNIIDKSSAFLLGVLIYHTIRQLRLVNSIYSNYVRINIYQLEPLQAFSRLTGSTALSLLVFVYIWMLINPELFTDPVLIGYLVVFTLIAIFVFVWPLWGVHRMIEAEKKKVLHELDLRFEAVFARFNDYVDRDEFAANESLNGTITSLQVQQSRLSTVPTWPWSADTARLVLTAIALPLMLMLLQYFILQALN